MSNTTVYAQRSSAVRAAKKAAGADKEWVIAAVANGFTFSILGVEEKQPAPVVLEKAPVFPNPVKEVQKAVKANPEIVPQTVVRPFQLAKQIVSDCISKGITSRKEIIATCVAAGIKLNTADGVHYELCVRKS